MPLGTAIVISLYDPETSEEKAKYTQGFVPWKLMKRAIKISKELKPDKETGEYEISEDTADALTDLVVDTFGGRFTREELENGADMSEMITVINQIIGKANGTKANPPPAG